MIKFIRAQDGSVDIHMDSTDAGKLAHAITTARPSGTAAVMMRTQPVRVHVHAEPAAPGPVHVPIGAR